MHTVNHPRCYVLTIVLPLALLLSACVTDKKYTYEDIRKQHADEMRAEAILDRLARLKENPLPAGTCVDWAGSFFMPVLIMMAIPLTLIGAMPGFWLLNLLTGSEVGGFGNPVFFTATGMIGMIALGGIVIRNSLILIEFIQEAIRSGTPFEEAILKSGAIRMRPILLTAATTALGAWPITPWIPFFPGSPGH